MQNFRDTFETRERLFISASSICMTVPLKKEGQQIPNAEQLLAQTEKSRCQSFL